MADTPAPTFEDIVLPHLDAAYRLARWMMRNDSEAEDVVQDASLRALRYFRTFSGGSGRAWFLTIVRNTARGAYGNRATRDTEAFDDERHSGAGSRRDARGDAAILIEQAMRTLPARFRALLALREIEGLSYRELADVMDVPIGTVMSGLSRARHALRLAIETAGAQSGGPKEMLRVCDSRSAVFGIHV